MDSDTAFEVEGALIDVYNLDELKNVQNGHYNSERGLQPDNMIEIRYGAEEVEITDPVFFGMITTAYNPFTTSDEDVYEICRKFWIVNPDLHRDVRYCLAVHGGVVRGVFTIIDWEKAEPPYDNPKDEGRRGFNGYAAPEEIIEKYLNKDISSYVHQNRKWVNC